MSAMTDFWSELQERTAKYDLLCHPFYVAWSMGELTHEDLRRYAAEYYPHVAAFPTYLSALHSRLEDGELRRAVLRNLADEEIAGAAHSDLWMNFATGMGNRSEDVKSAAQVKELTALIDYFRMVAQKASVPEVLATFYAYESQVPRIAIAKAKGLRELYGADAKTAGYFTLHQTADVHHSGEWKRLLDEVLAENPDETEAALEAAEGAAAALWCALDGIERERQARKAN